MIRFLTAGESHGPALTAIIEGFPAGMPVDFDALQADMDRRRRGYGRGGRMAIEGDRVNILSGVRHGVTLGSPITLQIINRDWEKWQEAMAVERAGYSDTVAIDADPALKRIDAVVTRPRPGHADLAGVLKYGHDDIRNVLERASARETATRVAVGAMARQLLAQFGISIFSGVLQIGQAVAEKIPEDWEVYQANVNASPVATPDPAATDRMTAEIDRAKENGDSLGGILEVLAVGVPVGLGSHVQWDRRLDARLSAALMSIPAIKGVAFGLGFEASALPGSQVHDAIYYDPERGYYRKTNHAGGIEGGISNGETIRVRLAMKPIPTLYRPLPTVNLLTKAVEEASVERSDTCAVPAAAVVAEAMVSWVLADAMMEKFGGDSLTEIQRNLEVYRQDLRSR
ncbi:MAG TPA: chorismate synthase [Bacillota bacterium]|nr:chorismate synthase [Bacillota bacterium]HPT87354.1 chorismate synthase [Bacillota bacterium]